MATRSSPLPATPTPAVSVVDVIMVAFSQVAPLLQALGFVCFLQLAVVLLYILQ